MRIYQDYNHKVTKIDFCCGEISKAILLRRIKASVWTNHAPKFYIAGSEENINLNNCPFCGDEIQAFLTVD